MTRRPVVISAAAVLNALAEDLDDFGRALAAGRSAISAADEHVPSAAHTAAGAFLDGFDLREWAARHLDDEAARTLVRAARRCALPAQTAACVAVRALRAAELDADLLAPTSVLVAGSNLALGYQHRVAVAFEQGRAPQPSHALVHMDIDVVGAVGDATGCRGEGWCLGASAASGTLALIQATRMIRGGDIDRCLVIGPCCELGPAELRALSDAGALAGPDDADPTHVCRPFDTARRGFVPGQGAAAVLLESADSLADRAGSMLARIVGVGVRLDGRRGMDPALPGQISAMRSALADAGLSADSVDYVNAHAAGTRAGDACEAEAIHTVFGTGPLVNSTKELIGHGMGAAGVQETVATVLQLRNGFCHPNPNLTDPCHPGVRFVGPRTVRGDLTTAIKNAVGVSGISAAIVLTTEEAPCGP
ncbi:polyketide beta-ketoacyl:ACP synthase [Nocardia panacis]|uniref:Polyketide beta-ketoacyl:ACP synthase n=1 Tax=Nocardia panacis TaxID=2340916 RepID=A0A3A4KAW9_9NOCA|nr:beta-ketoacyl synthase N-terminal-like domain-containing protein [Nocardia panacis]RJO70741.1 polyketide beta-ketoacyl:ACP synthase [Nocardia panacis]